MAALWSSFRRKSEESYSDDYDDDYEDDYNTYDSYESTPQSWETPGAQPIRSAADMQIALVVPEQYSDASKIADLLRDMKLGVLNLSRTESDVVSRRLLDFISGVIYAEDGKLMKVSRTVFIAAPYFVDLFDEESKKKIRSAIDL